MGILNKTKCTVIGPMQYSNGQNIREYFRNELRDLNIIIFDHYNKPFTDKSVDESQDSSSQWKQWLLNGEYDKIAARKAIRSYDLSLVERSDFIIFHFLPNVITVGSWEEFFLANRCKRPIFFITEGGKQLTPYWVFWTIPHKYIYSSKEEVLTKIKDIDSGKIIIDSDRWRLLEEQYR